MFFSCSSLVSIDFSTFDTSRVTSMVNLLFNCSSLVSVNFANSVTTSLESMSNMFLNCSSLTSLDLSSFNTAKVKDFNNLFYNCSNLSYIDISTFHESLQYNNLIFEGINDSGKIIISENISTIINQIFDELNLDWTITEK